MPSATTRFKMSKELRTTRNPWGIILAVIIGAAVIFGLTQFAAFLWASACPGLAGCDSLVAGRGGPLENYIWIIEWVPALAFVVGSIPTLRTGRPRSALAAFGLVVSALAAVIISLYA
jgi:hypothetical protein